MDDGGWFFPAKLPPPPLFADVPKVFPSATHASSAQVGRRESALNYRVRKYTVAEQSPLAPPTEDSASESAPVPVASPPAAAEQAPETSKPEPAAEEPERHPGCAQIGAQKTRIDHR